MDSACNDSCGDSHCCCNWSVSGDGQRLGFLQLNLYRVIISNIQLSLKPSTEATPLLSAGPTFFILLIFGFVYQALLLYDTLAQRNTIQLFGLCIYAVCLFIYAALQVDEVHRVSVALEEIGDVSPDNSSWITTKPLVLANASITALYLIVVVFISFKLYAEWQWTLYRELNADLAMQRRYFTFKAWQVQIFVSKLDRWH